MNIHIVKTKVSRYTDETLETIILGRLIGVIPSVSSGSILFAFVPISWTLKIHASHQLVIIEFFCRRSSQNLLAP